MVVDLTNSELFKGFTEFEKDGIYIDLHNEFDCQSIEYSSDLKQMMLSFTPNGYCTRKVKTVELIFNDCSIERYSSKFDKSDAESGTIDIMYRGRFEMSKEQLSETLDGRFYSYINFFPNTEFELFARRVTANFDLI